MEIMHVYIFAVLLLYRNVHAHLFINDSGLELQYTVTGYNHCLPDEPKIQTYVGRDLDGCITACALRPHCETLTYHSFGSLTVCELFQTEDGELFQTEDGELFQTEDGELFQTEDGELFQTEDGEMFQTEDGELFQSEGSERVIRTGCVYIQKEDITIKKIPCKPECQNGTTCNTATKSCDYTECVSPPNVTNGNKIRFQCDVGIRTDRDANCQPDGEWSVSSVSCKPEDCKDLLDIGIRYSGVYDIYPLGTGNEGIKVRCDMDTPPGGWTIIQRRIDDRDFYKNWTDYKAGFGDISGSYWLGNDNIWALTSHKHYRLRVDLTAMDGMTVYDEFSIENETLADFMVTTLATV